VPPFGKKITRKKKDGSQTPKKKTGPTGGTLRNTGEEPTQVKATGGENRGSEKRAGGKEIVLFAKFHGGLEKS